MKTRVIQDEPEPTEPGVPGVPGDAEAALQARPVNLPGGSLASGGDRDGDARVGNPPALEPDSNGGTR